MAENQYQWTDNPTVSGISQCNTDVLNDCLMHLKYENSGGVGMPIGTIYSLNCSPSYVPEGSLPCDGTEYGKAQFSDLWDNYFPSEIYYAYYADTMYVGATATVYTTSEPIIGDPLYIFSDEQMEYKYVISGVGDDYVQFQDDVGSEVYTVTAYRDASKDVYNYTSLLDTCSYYQYEQDLATYGQCAKFAVDLANGIFRVPKIKDGAVIQQALTDGELGKSYNAGLPDHTHTLWGSGSYGSSANNALGNGTNSKQATLQDAIKPASENNPIYGNSDTVQMNAVALRHFVVVATGSINQSMMDWSAWASSLQGKADKTGVDGQFIPKQLQVMTGANAISGTEYDLSTYLPDDSHTYLVKFLLRGYDDDGEYFYYINTDVWNYNKTSTASAADSYLYGGIHSRQNTVSIDLPVGAGRCMQVVGSGADALNIFCIGYRRLGTNS